MPADAGASADHPHRMLDSGHLLYLPVGRDNGRIYAHRRDNDAGGRIDGWGRSGGRRHRGWRWGGRQGGRWGGRRCRRIGRRFRKRRRGESRHSRAAAERRQAEGYRRPVGARPRLLRPSATALQSRLAGRMYCSGWRELRSSMVSSVLWNSSLVTVNVPGTFLKQDLRSSRDKEGLFASPHPQPPP